LYVGRVLLSDKKGVGTVKIISLSNADSKNAPQIGSTVRAAAHALSTRAL